MTEQEHYETIDLPFYRQCVEPVLPPQVLDFHAHAWLREHWLEPPSASSAPGARYMVTEAHYSVEDLQRDGERIFPGRTFHAVVFGQPTPSARTEICNDYLAVPRPALYPLLITGRGMASRQDLENRMLRGNFFGYKVFLNWRGNAYASVTLDDMLGPEELAIANELALVVLWHVPGARRLADVELQRQLTRIASDYPRAQFVLAHCGRCYRPDEILAAIDALNDVENVYVDTSMVMDPFVLAVLLERIESRRMLFGTDLPVAAMRGRRVTVMDHWVDLVLKGYPPSEYRVQSDALRATFMVYEIVVAIEQAGRFVGLSAQQRRAVFWDNGMAILSRVRGGEALQKAAAHHR